MTRFHSFSVFLLCAVALFSGCSSRSIVPEELQSTPSRGDNSRVSVDWPGTYKGTLPCADCEGIETVITLRADNSYLLERRYLGRSVRLFVDAGSFTWNRDGGRITITPEKGEPEHYLVGENLLIRLDSKGRRIEGALAERYILRKSIDVPSAVNPDAPLQETYWKLTMLRGKPVATSERQREAHMVLSAEGLRVHGSGGCNRFFGTYKLNPGNRIDFSQVGATMMVCPDMESEQVFFKTLEEAESYTISGHTLQLNRARMAPLAIFEAVQFR